MLTEIILKMKKKITDVNNENFKTKIMENIKNKSIQNINKIYNIILMTLK